MAEKLNLGRLITFLVRIFQIGGLWKPKNDDTFRRLYIVYSWLFNFIFSVMYTAFMCANLYFIEDISQLTDMLVMSMTELALVLKIVNFYVNNSKLQEMLRRMHEFQLENEFEHTVMRSRLSFLAKSTILYYFCANTSFNTSTLSAMLSKQTKLIYSAYYPGMDWKHNTVAYWSLFGYQYVGILYTTCINLAIDSYFCIMMYMLAGQTIILGSRLSNIGARVGGMRKTTIEQRLELIKNIKTHNDIIEFIQNLQHCLWWSFSGQLFLSTIVMGSYAKEMLQVSADCCRYMRKRLQTCFASWALLYRLCRSIIICQTLRLPWHLLCRYS